MLEKVKGKIRPHELNLFRAIAIIAVLAFIVAKLPAFEWRLADRDEPAYAWQSLVIYKNPEMALSEEVNYPYYAFWGLVAAPLNAFFPPPLPTRITAFAFGIAGLFFIYLIGKKLFSEKAGLAAVVASILSPSFFYYSAIGIMDIPLTALSAIAIYLLITINKRRAILLAITLAAMYLMKTGSIVFLPAIAAFLLVKNRKKVSKRQFILGTGTLAVVCMAALALSPYKLEFVFRKIFIYEDFYIFLIKFPYWFVWLMAGTAMALYALVGMWQLRKSKDPRIALLFFWIISVCAIYVFTASILIRYYLLALPPFAVIAGHGFASLFEKGKKVAALVGIAALALFLWGYYWDAMYWGMPERILYFRQKPPQLDMRDDIISWFGENIGLEDKAIVLGERFVARTPRLFAELGLSNPREQLVHNPGKERFEAIVQEEGRSYFVITDNLSPARKAWNVSWLHDMDANAETYLSSFGFEKVDELPSELGESLLFYKKEK